MVRGSDAIEAGDRERHRQPMVVEAVGRRAAEAACRRGCAGRRRRPRCWRPGPQAGGDAGDPVRFLVAQLARAADRGRAAGPGGGEAQDGDLVDRRGDVVRAEVDRAQVGRAHREVGQRLADVAVAVGRGAVAVTARSSMSAPIRRRRSMIARRVGLTPTSRSVSSASGWIAPATSQKAAADTSPGTRWSTARTAVPPSTDHATAAVRIRDPVDRDPPRPEHALRVITRGDPFPDGRPTVGPQSPPAGSPTSPAPTAPGS